MNHAIVDNTRTSVTSEPSRVQSKTSLNKDGQELNQVIVENTDQGSINQDVSNESLLMLLSILIMHTYLHYLHKQMQEFSFYIFTSILPNFEPKGGNLDYTCRVICACCDQILRFFNFGGHFYYSNFSSWSNESALRFFDFTLFHGFFQVLSFS